MHGLDVRIIRIDDAPIADWSDDLELPAGETGEITVTGSVVARTYHNNPGATALAKIAHGASVRHRMGDVGYFDEVGRLWFCGRKAHRVVTQTRTLFTVPCEAIFNQHPRVSRSALVGGARAGPTDAGHLHPARTRRHGPRPSGADPRVAEAGGRATR